MRRAEASRIPERRRFPTRIMSVGVPSSEPSVTLEAKRTLGRVRENRMKTSPVATAVTTSPVSDSSTTRRFAGWVRGNMAPYPTVPMVCTLK